MIQPINALTPRASFRGGTQTNLGAISKKGAIYNACGLSLAAGGLTTAVARGYTTSFAHAGILGICGASLAMFFMTPHLIDKLGLSKSAKKQSAELLAKEDAYKATEFVKENLKTAKKLVPFKQQS